MGATWKDEEPLKEENGSSHLRQGSRFKATSFESQSIEYLHRNWFQLGEEWGFLYFAYLSWEYHGSPVWCPFPSICLENKHLPRVSIVIRFPFQTALPETWSILGFLALASYEQ